MCVGTTSMMSLMPDSEWGCEWSRDHSYFNNIDTEAQNKNESQKWLWRANVQSGSTQRAREQTLTVSLGALLALDWPGLSLNMRDLDHLNSTREILLKDNALLKYLGEGPP